VRTTIDVFAQGQLNQAFWEQNAKMKHEKAIKQAPDMVALLIAKCESNGAKSQMEVVKTFLESRVGLSGICRFKHAPIIRSAWLHLNRSESAPMDDMVDHWVCKIFYDV